MEEFSQQLLRMIATYGGQVVVALLVLLGGWIFAGWVGGLAQSALTRAKIDETLTTFLGKLARWGVLDDPEPAVVLLDLGDSAVNWSVRVWAKSDEFGDVKQAATRAVKVALDEAGIEIPFPQMDVHLTKAE